MAVNVLIVPGFEKIWKTHFKENSKESYKQEYNFWGSFISVVYVCKGMYVSTRCEVGDEVGVDCRRCGEGQLKRVWKEKSMKFFFFFGEKR